MTEKSQSSPPRSGIVIAGLVILLVIAVGLLVMLLNSRDQAHTAQMTAQAQIDSAVTAQTQAQRSAATAHAKLQQSETLRLGAEALNPGSDAELAALLSLQSLKLGYNADADLALAQSLARLNGTPIQGNQLRVFSDSAPLDHAVFSPDGKLIMAHTGSVLKWWDVQTGAEVRSAPVPGEVVGFSQDHALLLTTTADPSAWTAHVFETQSGTEVQHFTSQTKYRVAARLLTGDKYVITVGSNSADKLDTVMQLWNVQTGQEIKRFGNNERDAFASPNGKYVITFGRLGMVKLDGSTLSELDKFEDSQDFALFSPDSRYLVTGADDPTIILMVADTDHQIASFGDGGAPVMFSPDSTLLVITGKTRVHLIDLKTARERTNIDGGTGPAVFSPDSALLAVSVNDNTVHILDTRTRAVVRVLSGDTKPIDSLDFSPNGQYVLTTSEDGTARLWRADYHLTAAQVCQRLTRDLTDDERRKFDVPGDSPSCNGAMDTF